MGSFGGNSGQDRTDAQLLAAHIDGDRFAFEELFLRYQRPLYRLARFTTHNLEDAGDALQDAMLSAHCAAATFRQGSSVSSWLHRIVLNACLDRLRRRNARPAIPLQDWDWPVPDSTTHVENAMVVEQALMRLPVEQRAAVVAVDMQGFSVAETARMLGVAEGTVKSRRARARATLARVLAERPVPVAP